MELHSVIVDVYSLIYMDIYSYTLFIPSHTRISGLLI